MVSSFMDHYRRLEELCEQVHGIPITSERHARKERLAFAIEKIHGLTEEQREDLRHLLYTGRRRGEQPAPKRTPIPAAPIIPSFPPGLLSATYLPDRR